MRDAITGPLREPRYSLYSEPSSRPSCNAYDSGLIRELKKLLGPSEVLNLPEDLLLYEYDGSVEKGRPDIVAFPSTTAEVSELSRLAIQHQCLFVSAVARVPACPAARSLGSGGLMLVFSRMNRILELDFENQRAVVQPGVVNLDITRAVEHAGFTSRPIPPARNPPPSAATSRKTPAALTPSLTASRPITSPRSNSSSPTGEIVRVGSKQGDACSYDLTGLFVGSEGTLALVTEITVKLSRKPEAIKTLLAVFETVDDASETVADITARGITPAACEMLDGWTLRVIEDYIHAGFPLDSAPPSCSSKSKACSEAVIAQAASIDEICRIHNAREVRVARDDKERDLLWKGRKNSFGALGRIGCRHLCSRRRHSPLQASANASPHTGNRQSIRLQIGNVFHAGDGNLHPIVLYDLRDNEQFQRALTSLRRNHSLLR